MKFKKKTLKNGLRIITAPITGNSTTTVLVLVGAGTDYENKENNGISHFLEHMCFKGTKNRPNTGDIALDLDKLGARYNAFTGHEYTGYWAKTHHKKAGEMLNIVSDMYMNPIFDEKEIKKEKGVIIEEFNMSEDTPMRKIYSNFFKLLYKGQPAGQATLGLKKNVRRFKQKDFVDYRNKHYVAENTIVVVAGKFNEKEIISDIKKSFKDISTKKTKKKIKTKDIQSKPEISLEYKKSDQSHLLLGVRSYSVFEKDSLITSIIMRVLSAGMSSRLFNKLRNEMGVCYYVSAFNEAGLDHGFSGITAGVTNNRLKEVVKVLLEELNKLKKELVDEEELKKVKDYVIGNMYLGLESSDSIAEFFGFQELMKKKVDTPEEKIKKIKAVTAKDIKRVANKIFVNKGLNLAVIGPVRDKKSLQKILKF